MNAVELAGELRELGDCARLAPSADERALAPVLFAAADLLDGFRVTVDELLISLDDRDLPAGAERVRRALAALSVLVAPPGSPGGRREGPVVPAAAGPSVFAGPVPALAARPSSAGGVPHQSPSRDHPVFGDDLGPVQHCDELAARRARRKEGVG